MLSKREQLAADSRRLEERAVERRQLRQREITANDETIRDLRSAFHYRRLAVER